MDPRINPYTPNAGALPPALVGRDDQLASFSFLLDRLTGGYTEQSMLITGLRGVGKTVLINKFREIAQDALWGVVELEISKHDESAFRRDIALAFRQALFEIAPKERWKDRAKRAGGMLRSFSVGVDPAGTFTAGLGVERVEGQGDSGDLKMDLGALLLAMGEAAQDHGTGVVLLIDEVQFLHRVELEALVMALHRSVQRSLPITMVGAGLPQLAELAGQAKSYSERLFRFPVIGALQGPDARLALTDPAAVRSVTFANAALDEALDFTEGYPFFLQELGYAVWPIASGRVIRRSDIAAARQIVEEKLDASFFRVRLDRTTLMEKTYLRAMAELGPEPHSAGEVAALLHRTSQQCGPFRAGLIEKGLLFTPNHGDAAFTVPQFDQFMRRAIPELVVPPIRPRRRQGES
jgi:predicted ATPase